ncbi:hypothetical protein L208DRAFT_647521 [Tricholoma matsutake]|nr:hypothetical protein L208DRAFT_647521 [Tricholoma matsutake 945]
MSHCRHLFYRGYITRLTHRRLAIVGRSFSNVAIAKPPRSKTNRPNDLVLETLFRRDATFPSTSLSTSPHSTNSTHTPVDGMEPLDTKSMSGHEYEKLRMRNRHLVSNLPTASYLRVLKEALLASPDLANCVVKDILEVYRGKYSNQTYMLKTILFQDLSVLEPSVVLAVLQRLKNTTKVLDYLSLDSVARLARIIVSFQSSDETDRRLIQLIYPILSAQAASHTALGGPRSATYNPPAIIYAAFEVVRKLLRLSLQQDALTLFQILVNSRHIPPEIMQGLDSSSNDFNLIICIALAKASLHWNWRPWTVTIVSGLLDLPGTPHQSIIDLNVDILYAFLDAPTVDDIRGCRQLICRAHPHAPVPNIVIRQFYSCAERLLQGGEAEALYEFTRTPSILSQHHYPPPHGLALPWLMHHLTEHSRKAHLSRQLAFEVVEDNLPLPLQFRARFISNTVALSYASCARKLWERYSVGDDKHVVVGNSALMIRMLRLFAQLLRHARASYDRFEGPKVRADILQGKLEDLTNLLTQILQSYRAHHIPLIKAPHRALTSLARGFFIVGKYTEGLQVFKVLLQRKEIPDIYDVNVALTAVAEADPRLAARMIGRMIEKGLQPDAVTFGTVMHHAFLFQDEALVDEMMEGIRGLKDARLTLQSIGGLIRASVSSRMDDPDSLKTRLQSVLTMIESFETTTPLTSPQTGKYLVYISLRAKDSMMAYKFWNLLLRESAEWNDMEQQVLRRRIAEMIKKNKAWLDNDETQAMVAKLDRSDQ